MLQLRCLTGFEASLCVVKDTNDLDKNSVNDANDTYKFYGK